MLEGGGSGVQRPAPKPIPKKKSPSSSMGSALGRAAGRVTSKVKRSPSRSYSNSSGRNSGGNRSGGGGGNGNGGGGGGYTPPKTPAVPQVPSIDSYLGTDSIYQDAVSGGKRTLTDFLSDISRRKGEAGTQFNQTKANMERDRTQQLEDLRNEFASRGLIQSGLFGEEQGKFQSQFTEQQTALEQQQAGLLADLLSQETNYRREQDLALQAAKQEALQRRAAKYKIGA